MKAILQIIRRLWCKHNSEDIVFQVRVRSKIKHTRSGYNKLRFDIWEEGKCSYCGKILAKVKVKSDLTETQMRRYIDNAY